MPDQHSLIAQILNVRPQQVTATVELLDGGNTVPFIARYRKEMTGTLDEEQIRSIQAEVTRLRALEERQAAVLASIAEQGKLTGELEQQIRAATTLTMVEDLYAPYKPRRRTRASIAREKGLQALADLILQQPRDARTPQEAAAAFVGEQVATVEEALSGARDIAAEVISDHAEVRRQTREKAMKFAELLVSRTPHGEDPKGVFTLYYEYQNRVERLRPHQVLAIDRGESEGVLHAQVEVPEKDWRSAVRSTFQPDPASPFAEELELAITDSAARLLLPAIQRDVRRELTVGAQLHAIRVFAENLRGLLSQPPITHRVVLGLDPGFRTGCKLAVVDETGRVLETGTIYPHEPQKHWSQAAQNLREIIRKHRVSLVSIGNGTASRETEQLVAEVIRGEEGVRYLITSESGASVYSASPLARLELPGLDVSLRGAVSIARRVQDPLAELVKIDPRSIGVGLYQHDVDQGLLKTSLDGVVEDVVNRVGVDTNTASPALLAYVSGIGEKLAERIVAYREVHGAFRDRTGLHEVEGLGPKSFEQCAGFLRIHGGTNPLDSTAIHPESYPVAEVLLQRTGIQAGADLAGRRGAVEALRKAAPLEKLADDLGCGLLTLADILEQLVRPGRDPRQDAPPPILRSDVLKVEDLSEGMQLKGTVRNVVDFGAFIDIGVKQDGLAHRSQIPFGTVLQVADIVEVEILKVEQERGRIALKVLS